MKSSIDKLREVGPIIGHRSFVYNGRMQDIPLKKKSSPPSLPVKEARREAACGIRGPGKLHLNDHAGMLACRTA